MIAENPWHPTNFTNHFWFARTTLIDKDRTRRGDYFRKPTAYWFINCTPTHGETYQQTPKDKIRSITAGSGTQRARTKIRESGICDKTELDRMFVRHKTDTGLCDEERSMISPDYARNFICDFIIGKEQVNTQLNLF